MWQAACCKLREPGPPAHTHCWLVQSDTHFAALGRHAFFMITMERKRFGKIDCLAFDCVSYRGGDRGSGRNSSAGRDGARNKHEVHAGQEQRAEHQEDRHVA